MSGNFQPEAASAAPASSAPKPEDRATTMEAGSREGEKHLQQYDGATLLVCAYAVLWAILMAWIALVWKKQRSLHGRLDDLEAVIDAAAAQKQQASAPAARPKADGDQRNGARASEER